MTALSALMKTWRARALAVLLPRLEALPQANNARRSAAHDRESPMTTSAQKIIWPAMVAVVLHWRLAGPRGGLQPAALPGAEPAAGGRDAVQSMRGCSSAALYTTLKITLFAFICATAAGRADRVCVRAEPRHRDGSVPLRRVAAGDAHRRHRAADHHLGQGPDGVAGDLRHARRACSPSSPTPRSGLRSVNPGLMSYFKLNRATRVQTLLRLRIPSALAVLLRWAAHQQRPGADRCRGGRVRGRHGWHRHGPRVPDPAGGLPAQHPAHVRGAGVDHASPACCCLRLMSVLSKWALAVPGTRVRLHHD